MDAESADWLEALRLAGAARDEAQSRLHRLLLRVAHAEAGRRAPRLPAHTIAEFDDLCMQAADDALITIMRKLDTFQGLSRFTTWASKFVILEISSRLRRHVWRDRRIAWSDATWERLWDLTPTADQALEQREQYELLRQAFARDLTDRQRMVLTAVAVEEIPIDVLAERLGSSRGAIYKMLHDARVKLRYVLTQDKRAEALPCQRK
jgi:RNA polymerase sigma-70 factor (ECF subfamily)